MRVGLLIYGSLDTRSGGYLYDRKLVEHLRSQGDSVDIISIPWRNYFMHLSDNLSRRLLNGLRKLSLDVLIQDELNHPSLAWLNKDLETSYPVISLVHHLRSEESHPGWKKKLYSLVERRYLDSVDGFIFNSQTTKESVEKHTQVNGRPWVIATPAGDRFGPPTQWESINEPAVQDSPLRLLFVGNLIPRKGLHILIEALGLLEDGCCRLDVVGSLDADPGYVRRVFSRVDVLGLLNKIKFHGEMEDQKLMRIYEASQLLVVPSSFEGFGIVYLEGMRFGLPGIGTNQGAAREIIQSGKNGYLIAPDDVSGLANLLTGLHHDRRRLKVLRINAWKHQQQFPSWGESMANARRFLQEIAGGSNKSHQWR
jgi:glycosyltransferase involved in cell wall biosynthesis